MDMDKTLLMRLSGLLAALAIPASGVWWMSEQTARANDQEVEQKSIAQAVQTLTAIHARQEAIEEAEDAMTRKLCRLGKLKGADCAGVEPTPTR